MTNGMLRTREFTPVYGEFDRMLRHVFGDTGASPVGAFSPALDVEEDAETFILHVELPGIDAAAMDVSLEDNVLTVAGERNFYDDRDSDGFRRVERNFGRFHRAVRLPDRVDANAVEASYRDGLLTITVPKAEEAKPRRIEVKTP